jgi:hypothetical protein
MDEKKIKFMNKNQKIIGVLHIPNIRNPPGILMAHGFSVDKDEHGLFVKTAREFCRNGFMVLRFDFRGSGESGGRFEDIKIGDNVSDLKKAIEFMSKQKINKQKIGLLGASFGGAISILALNQKIKALVLWNPTFKIKEVFEDYFKKIIGVDWLDEIEDKGFVLLYKKREKKFFKITKEFWNDMKNKDLNSFARKINCPTLIVHGDKDTIVPLAHSKELFKILKKPKQIKIIEGSEHGFHDQDSSKEAIDLSLKWFVKWLK